MGFPEPIPVSANTWLEIADKPSVMQHDPKSTVPEELAVGHPLERNICVSLGATGAQRAGNQNNVSVYGTRAASDVALTLVRKTRNDAQLYLQSLGRRARRAR